MRLVVAIDGGGSKTDVVVAEPTGAVLARHRGPGCSQQVIGLAAAARVVDAAVVAALAEAGAQPGDVGHAACYLTGIDLDDEQRAMHAALSEHAWAARSLVVDNDVFALLRAGTAAPDAAVVVCGTGINGAAVAGGVPAARVLALGQVSGDWGGATGLIDAALWHAARADDGRGEPTALTEAIPSWVGRPDMRSVVVDVHTGRLALSALWPRVPDLMALAHAGDAVAAALVRRQGAEIGLLAAALITRAGLIDTPVPVVLGGGIASSGDRLLSDAIAAELGSRAPRSWAHVAERPPVDGALDLALAAAEALAG